MLGFRGQGRALAVEQRLPILSDQVSSQQELASRQSGCPPEGGYVLLICKTGLGAATLGRMMPLGGGGCSCSQGSLPLRVRS